jgi:hypothetical protein
MLLLQANVGVWWASGWFWLFLGLVLIAIVALLPWSWRSPRRRR